MYSYNLNSYLYIGIYNSLCLFIPFFNPLYSRYLNNNPPTPMSLSLEQEFSILSFKQQVDSMSEEQCKSSLVNAYQAMLEMEANYKELLKHNWNL